MYAGKTHPDPSCPAWLVQQIQAAVQGSSSNPRLTLVLVQVLGVAALALFGAIGAWLGKAATVWHCCVHLHATSEPAS